MRDAFNKTPVTKTLLREVHKLRHRRLQGVHFLPSVDSRTTVLYLRSTTKQDRLNKCLLMHCHKSITDTPCTLLRLQRGLLVPKNYAKDILVNPSRGMRLTWCTMSPPPPPPPPHTHTHTHTHTHVSKRSAASDDKGVGFLLDIMNWFTIRFIMKS